MGAVCYQPKKKTVSKEEILRAMGDKSKLETITDPDHKTLKTEQRDEIQGQTFNNNFTQNINLESFENQVRKPTIFSPNIGQN